MKIFHGFEGVEAIPGAVVTTGSFDGVHIGHKVILNRINKLAREIGGESVLITFHPHPRKVLFPETEGKNLRLINSQAEKISLLEKSGLDNLVIVPFSIEFSRISSADFIRNYLLSRLHARIIVIGFNHHFGHNRKGDFDELRRLGLECGFQVEEIPEQDIEHETVSSTKIRQALLQGNIGRANAYLDHQFVMAGPVLQPHIDPNHGILVSQLAIEEDVKLIPPDGMYAATLLVGSQQGKALVVIKNNPEQVLHSQVQVFDLEGQLVNPNPRITLLFQKTLALTPDQPDDPNLFKKMREHTEELIF